MMQEDNLEEEAAEAFRMVADMLENDEAWIASYEKDTEAFYGPATVGYDVSYVEGGGEFTAYVECLLEE